MQFVFRINSDRCFKTLFSPRAEARGNSEAIHELSSDLNCLQIHLEDMNR